MDSNLLSHTWIWRTLISASTLATTFLHSMMMVAIKQVYGYVIWFALALAALFLLCDIPAVRTNIRKVPRWPVYAIEYLARRK